MIALSEKMSSNTFLRWPVAAAVDSLLPLTAEIATLSYHHDFQDDLTVCVWVPCVWTSKAAVHRPIILPPCHHGNILAAQEA